MPDTTVGKRAHARKRNISLSVPFFVAISLSVMIVLSSSSLTCGLLPGVSLGVRKGLTFLDTLLVF
jgi:hypothetical protein